MPPSYHHGDLRQAFLDAALATLDADGELPSWRALARTCGVSQTAPYRHFESFEALQAAVAAEAFARLAAAIGAARRAARGPRGRLAAGLRAYVDFGRRHPSWYELMFGRNLTLLKRPEVAAAGTDAYRILVDAIAECGVREAVRTAFALWSTVHGITDLAGNGLRPPAVGGGPVDERAAIDTVVAMCVAEVERAALADAGRAGRKQGAARRRSAGRAG